MVGYILKRTRGGSCVFFLFIYFFWEKDGALGQAINKMKDICVSRMTLNFPCPNLGLLFV